MSDWKRKLKSRKLWMSIGTFASMLLIFLGYSEDKAVQVASLIVAGGAVVAYIIGEGIADSNPTPINTNPVVSDEVKEDPEDEE